MERRKKKEKKKDMWFGKEETKLPLFADDMVLWFFSFIDMM